METKSNSPLRGRTIVVTRPKEQAVELQNLLEARGARVIVFPTITINEPPSWTLCDRAIGLIENYHGLIFTSANAVRYFFNRLKTVAPLIKDLPSIYVVGEATKQAVETFGFKAMNFGSNAASLAGAVSRLYPQNSRFLFLKGNLAGNDLTEILSQNQHGIDEAIVYVTNPPAPEAVEFLKSQMAEKTIDLITFFSPSAVRNFFELFPLNICKDIGVAVIGTTTEKAVRALNLPVTVVAPEPQTEALVRAISAFYDPQLKESREYAIVE